MTLKVPKVSSTRLSLPTGLSGAEPTNAMPGTLAFATDTELVRVQTSLGWVDVGSGGGGTISLISSGYGITVTNPAGPTVTVAANTTEVVSTDFTTYPTKASPVAADRIVINDSAAGFVMKFCAIGALPFVSTTFSTYSTKTTPVGADTLPINDSAAGSAMKVITISSLNTAIGGPFVSTTFSTYTLKSPAVLADVLVINDSAAAGAMKRTTVDDLPLVNEAFSTYSAKTTLVSADTFVINDSAASNAVKDVTFANLITSLGTIAPSGNPYIDPPLVASALDDEFSSGSADLAVRGWTVKNSAGTTMTRLGDIAPWNSATALTASQYNSTIVGSVLQVQVALGTAMRFYKAVSWTSGSGQLVWARLGNAQYRSGASTGTNFISVNAWYSTGGNTDGNNRLLAQLGTVGTSGSAQISTGRVTAGAASLTTTTSALATPDIFGIKLLSGTTAWDCFIGDTKTGSIATDSTGTNVATSVAFAGIEFNAAATTTAATTNSQLFSIDFFRAASGATAWIGQTPRPVAWNVVDANFADYTTKSVPVVADTIVINDSAASGAVKTSTLGNIRIGDRSPLTGLNPSPDAWNLEARYWTDPDVAANGWSITERGTATVLTRAGDVDANTTIAANTYRSTLRGGVLVIQTRTNVITQIAKATTLGTNVTYKAHNWSTDYGTGYYQDVFVSDNINPTTTNARSYYLGLEQTNIVEALLVGPATFTTYATTGAAIYHNDNVKYLRLTSATSMGSYFVMVTGPGIVGSVARNPALTIQYAGVWFNAVSANGFFFLDYIRRSTVSSFDFLA